MSRTPLSRAIGRWLAPRSDSGARGGHRRLVTRRHFLAVCAMAGGAAFGLSRLPRRRSPATTERIAIVGGGIAGLICAWRLRSRGVAADIYEARADLGGRIITDRATFPGQHCELGGEFIDSDHRSMRGLAAELGIELLDYGRDGAGLEDLTAFIGGRRLSERELADGFAPIAAAIRSDLLGLPTGAIDASWRSNRRALELDRLSLAEWLDRAGAAGPVRRLIEVAYTIEFGIDPERNNALNMLLLVSGDAERLAIFGDSDERYHAAGGNDLFIRRLRERLEPERIHPGHRLEAVRPGADGRYTLTFARESATVDVVADRVVLALPFSVLRAVHLAVDLPEAKRRAISELGYGVNAKLMVGFASRLWRAQRSRGLVFSDLPFQNTWDTSRMQPGEAGILTDFTGGARALAVADGTVGDRAREFASQLEQLFPGAEAAATGRCVRMAWARQPFALGSYSSYLVGQYGSIAGDEAPAVGALHFCGEHTCPEHQGYMEGGARSGERVAIEIAAALGVARSNASHARASAS